MESGAIALCRGARGGVERRIGQLLLDNLPLRRECREARLDLLQLFAQRRELLASVGISATCFAAAVAACTRWRYLDSIG